MCFEFPISKVSTTTDAGVFFTMMARFRVSWITVEVEVNQSTKWTSFVEH